VVHENVPAAMKARKRIEFKCRESQQLGINYHNTWQGIEKGEINQISHCMYILIMV
jgi:hypothetical protein